MKSSHQLRRHHGLRGRARAGLRGARRGGSTSSRSSRRARTAASSSIARQTAAETVVAVPNTYADLSLAERPVILKVHGGVDAGPTRGRESFVVSEDDYIGYLAQSELANVLPVTLAAKLRRSHLLFVAYPVVEWSLRVFLHRVFGDEPISYRSWAVLPGRAADPARVLAAAGRGSVRRRARGFRGRARAAALGGRAGVILETPYKGLVPFEDTELDALLFFGRERESEIIAANVLASRLTVLYGPSGVGKSSVLRAGVAHRLRRQAQENVDEARPSGVRRRRLRRVERRPGRRHSEQRCATRWPSSSARRFSMSSEGSRSRTRFGRWTEALACDLLLMLDQAEEYFLYHAEETGLRARAARSRHAAPDCACACCSRSATTRSPSSTGSRGASRTCSRTTFGSTISTAARRERRSSGRSSATTRRRGESVEIEPELVEAVLDQTAAGKVDLGRSGPRPRGRRERTRAAIEAPYLQLVMERVWDEERGAGLERVSGSRRSRRSAAPRRSCRPICSALSPELTADEQDVAADVFRYLVTPSGTKIAHGAGDLAEYAAVDERAAAARALDAGPGAHRPHRRRSGLERRTVRDLPRRPRRAGLAWRREQELERERRAAARRQRRLYASGDGRARGAGRDDGGRDLRVQPARQRADGEPARPRASACSPKRLHQLDIDPQLSMLLGLEAAKTDRTAQTQDVLSQAVEASRMRDVQRVSDTAPPSRTAGRPASNRRQALAARRDRSSCASPTAR